MTSVAIRICKTEVFQSKTLPNDESLQWATHQYRIVPLDAEKEECNVVEEKEIQCTNLQKLKHLQFVTINLQM